MNEELFQKINDAVDAAADKAIGKYVNGKIDKLTGEVEELRSSFDKHLEEHKADREELKEIIQAKSSLTFLFKSLLGLGSLAAAWLAIRGVFIRN